MNSTCRWTVNIIDGSSMRCFRRCHREYNLDHQYPPHQHHCHPQNIDNDNAVSATTCTSVATDTTMSSIPRIPSSDRFYDQSSNTLLRNQKITIINNNSKSHNIAIPDKSTRTFNNNRRQDSTRQRIATAVTNNDYVQLMLQQHQDVDDDNVKSPIIQRTRRPSFGTVVKLKKTGVVISSSSSSSPSSSLPSQSVRIGDRLLSVSIWELLQFVDSYYFSYYFSAYSYSESTTLSW